MSWGGELGAMGGVGDAGVCAGGASALGGTREPATARMARGGEGAGRGVVECRWAGGDGGRVEATDAKTFPATGALVASGNLAISDREKL